jgi:hypothetical protein
MMRKRARPEAPGVAPAESPMPRRRRVAGCRRGAVTAEFGLIMVPVLILFVGLMEVAWQATTASLLDAGALRASRFGVTGQTTLPGAPESVTCREQAIKWMVSDSTGGFLRLDRLQVATQSWSGIAGMGGTATAGAGLGGQVVTYTLTYTQPFFTFGLIGAANGRTELTHRAVMVVKNEPFLNTPAACAT